jgi:hypothetical protein
MPTQVVNRKIADDAKQPRPDLSFVVGQPLVLEEAQRGLLRQLLCDALPYNQPGRVIHQLATMPLIDVGARVGLQHGSTSLSLS